MVGVRTGDKGVDRHGHRKPNFEPGSRVREGDGAVRGPARHAGQGARDRLGLTGRRSPQVYATGVKEIWEMPAGRVQKGRVIHTMGWPLPTETFGGGFTLRHGRAHWAVGFVTGLDSRDPTATRTATSSASRRTRVAALPRGRQAGRLRRQGDPRGRWWAMPRLSADGLLLRRRLGGFLNGARLKGIHLAIKSGMLAAETLFECLLRGRLLEGAAGGLRGARPRTRGRRRAAAACATSTRASSGGLYAGMLNAGLQMLTGGRDLLATGSQRRRGTSACAGCASAHPGGKPGRREQVRRRAHLRQARPTSTSRARSTTRTSRCTSWCADTERLRHEVPRGVRQPLPALLPGAASTRWCRRRGARRAAAADQRLELRALQDLRHRRPLPDHHLGAARGRRRAALRGHVATSVSPPRRRASRDGSGGETQGKSALITEARHRHRSRRRPPLRPGRREGGGGGTSAGPLEETVRLSGRRRSALWRSRGPVQPDRVPKPPSGGAEQEFGEIGILFNNHGTFEPGSVPETSPESWDRVLSDNLKIGLPDLPRGDPRDAPVGGSIINTASTLGVVAMRDAVAYCAAKGGR